MLTTEERNRIEEIRENLSDGAYLSEAEDDIRFLLSLLDNSPQMKEMEWRKDEYENEELYCNDTYLGMVYYSPETDHYHAFTAHHREAEKSFAHDQLPEAKQWVQQKVTEELKGLMK